jgi:hypothetical protein
MGQAHGLPLRQARASIGPAYLDCCSSNRSLSMLFARSPVLHVGTCPILCVAIGMVQIPIGWQHPV